MDGHANTSSIDFRARNVKYAAVLFATVLRFVRKKCACKECQPLQASWRKWGARLKLQLVTGGVIATLGAFRGWYSV